MEKRLIDGHRDRARNLYLNSSIKYLPDHHILELILFYAIPRKDVKPLAFDIIQKFGSLKGALNADIEQLTKINGVGENTAFLIKLIGDIAYLQKFDDEKRISTSTVAEEYATSLLQGLPVERLIIIALDDDQKVILSKTIAEGDRTGAIIDPKKIVEFVIDCNAKSVILAHNHPNASAIPSTDDVNFTVEVLNLLRPMGVKVNDHIIVGNDTTKCMGDMMQYANFFDR